MRRVEAVVEHYRDIGIDVVNSTGDQFSLLCESLPGERVRLNSYVQRQPLYTIAGGMPTATVDLGDRADETAGWVGPYIGETLGRARSIVHFDPLLAAARNRPTAVAITGEPGGGKTTLALLLIYQLALRGATVAVIDPKGDAESLVDVPEAAAAARPGCCRSARRRRGCSTRSRSALDLSEKRTMATETLRLLLPRMSEERESAMIQAVGAVAGTDRPSLGKVVTHLEQSDDPAWKNTGAVMRSISEMRLARLCFAPSVDEQIDAEGWTTVFTLAGLTLPDTNDQPGRLLLRAAAVGGPALPGLPVRPQAAERHRPEAAEGDLPGRGLGDHLHSRGRQAGARGVTDGPVAQHRADPGLAECR